MTDATPLNPDQSRLVAEPSGPPVPEEAPMTAAARPWGPWATIGWMLVTIAALIIVQIVVAIVFVVVQMSSGSRIRPEDFQTNGNLFASAALATAPVVIGLAALLIYLRGCSIGEYLALVRPSLRQSLISAAGFVLLIAGIDLATQLLSRPIVSPVMAEVYRTASLPLLLLALLVAAPLAEEVLFRGFAFRGIAQSHWGPGLAIVLPSLAWAALHIQYDFYMISTIVVMGLYLGWVRHRSGSLVLTILLHALANVIATVEMVVQERLARG